MMSEATRPRKTKRKDFRIEWKPCKVILVGKLFSADLVSVPPLKWIPNVDNRKKNSRNPQGERDGRIEREREKEI